MIPEAIDDLLYSLARDGSGADRAGAVRLERDRKYCAGEPETDRRSPVSRLRFARENAGVGYGIRLGQLLVESPCGLLPGFRHQAPRTGLAAVPLHALPQLDSRPQQAGLSRRHRDPQLFGEFGHGQLLHIPQQKHVAQQRRNASDFGLQDLCYFAAAEFALRIRSAGTQLHRLASVLGPPVIQTNKLHAPPTPDEHQTLVLHNPKKPGRKLGVSLELIQVLECLPAGILCFFLGLAVIAKNGRRQANAALTMTADQFAEGIMISEPCCLDELYIANSSKLIQPIVHFVTPKEFDYRYEFSRDIAYG
jgi:hypothetical protein